MHVGNQRHRDFCTSFKKKSDEEKIDVVPTRKQAWTPDSIGQDDPSVQPWQFLLHKKSDAEHTPYCARSDGGPGYPEGCK